jgi:hypothetical protein
MVSSKPESGEAFRYAGSIVAHWHADIPNRVSARSAFGGAGVMPTSLWTVKEGGKQTR